MNVGTLGALGHLTAPALVEVAADPMAAVRALNRMTHAGFVLALEDNALVVSPADRLNDAQRAFIRAHKSAQGPPPKSAGAPT